MTDPNHNRPRMTPQRSASVKGHVSGAERMRARRKTGRKPMLPAVLIAAALLVMILLIGWVQNRVGRIDPREYPMRYTEEVEAASREFGVDPAYLYAVILAESGFRPDAVSNVGALGLMQIMPETGEWLAGKLDIKDSFRTSQLTDPELNVRMGAWYLNYLLKRYDGDKRCASAAYHAGQGTVDKWLKDPEKSPDGKTLAVIAYDSTNYYVNKVLKNYENYSALLSEQH